MNEQYFQKLPDYEPYSEWKIGSNTLKNVKYFIYISGYIPLMIGKVKNRPCVWLSALIENEIINLIEYNNSNFIQFMPILHIENCLEWNFFNPKTRESNCLLRLEYYEDSIYITNLDLRCIGISIFIENNALIVGSARLEGNTIEGGISFINIED